MLLQANSFINFFFASGDLRDMVPVQNSSIILVVADSGFANLCDDPNAYVLRLKKILGERALDKLTIMTVSGRYGIGLLAEDIKVVEVDDKNKTMFSQTLENVSGIFDELLAITNTSQDNFINAAKEVMGNASKTITTFGYPRKK